MNYIFIFKIFVYNVYIMLYVKYLNHTACNVGTLMFIKKYAISLCLDSMCSNVNVLGCVYSGCIVLSTQCMHYVVCMIYVLYCVFSVHTALLSICANFCVHILGMLWYKKEFVNNYMCGQSIHV